MSPAYYNEFDPYCAAWLRNLIAAGHIPAGEVDERDIRKVTPDDLQGFQQCHFFCGIGGWPYAGRLAGIPDDFPLWTGSCPCQPVSSAGQRKGHADERHLWPAFHALIAECRPATVFGEQVASKDGREWLAGVRADLEHLGYAVGAADLPAAGVGAPHIRQRLWWVANAGHSARRAKQRQQSKGIQEHAGSFGGVGISDGRSVRRDARGTPGEKTESPRSRQVDGHGRLSAGSAGPDGGLALPDGRHASPEGLQRGGQHRQQPQDGGSAGRMGDARHGRGSARPTRREQQGGSSECEESLGAGPFGFWSGFDLVPCADGKARRVESFYVEMVDGLPPSLGPISTEQVAEIEQEVMRYADAHQADAREALHDLWCSLSAEILGGRTPRRPDRVHEAPFLLSFLRQLSEQGWTFSECLSRTSAETQERFLRSMWWKEAAPRSSCGRGLDEHRPREYPDALRVLSSILARHAQTAWADAFDSYAALTNPLAHGVPARVGKLRAYGNAIVPQVAAEFMRAAMEADRG